MKPAKPNYQAALLKFSAALTAYADATLRCQRAATRSAQHAVAIQDGVRQLQSFIPGSCMAVERG